MHMIIDFIYNLTLNPLIYLYELIFNLSYKVIEKTYPNINDNVII